MTNRSFLKCDVCGAVTLMRLQVGWLEEHPIRVPCGKCGILISGTVYFDQEKADLHYKIHNASSVGETVPDFYVEASGELLAEKLKRHIGGPFVWAPPPFFQASGQWATPHDTGLIEILVLVKRNRPLVTLVTDKSLPHELIMKYEL